MDPVAKAQEANLNSLGVQVPIKYSKLISYIAQVLCIIFLAAPLMGQSWSFSLLGDPRSGTRDFKAALKQIQAGKDLSGAVSGLPEFILIAGDFDPDDTNYAIYRDAFSGTQVPRLLPVMGNHDAGFRRYIFETIMPKEGIQARFAEPTISYFVDVKNIRVIVVDQYQGTGFQNGCINEAGIRWVEEAINSANGIDHIFVAMHVPPFCRVRHVGDGFEACPELRNRFWDMVVRHRDRVRAILGGHTHNYSVMRVQDPRGSASDGRSYPIENDGVYQFDAGGAGNSDDGKITVITFHIDGQSAVAKVVQSPNGQARFSAVKTVDLLAR